MRSHSRIIVLFLLSFIVFNRVGAQSVFTENKNLLSNFKTKKIPIIDSLIIDSLSTAGETLSIKDIDENTYVFFPEQSLLIWKQKPALDSVRISYRTLAIALNHHYHNKSFQLVDSNIAFSFSPDFSQKKNAKDGDFVEFNSLEYNGNYGRSLMIGNQQDVSLNSNFDLQLNGYILDSIRIEAALSDNNIPFQPEGNTQHLQEFDKVYITFEKGNHKFTAGDYELSKPNSYFLNFDKRVQGLNYQGRVVKTKNIENKIGISGSVAKGEFTRNIFQGEEGNQGPYRLTANHGEQFFIVLAGSETVYIDGQILKRGEQADYTIDYNTAEILFMPSRMITKDTRIQIEFEYQSRNYLNTLLHVYDELKIKDKWRINLNVYSNQDAKNQPYMQELSDEHKAFLGIIGDRIQDAYYPNIRPDTLGENKVLYRLKDTIVEGVHYDSVFAYSYNQDSTLYALGFSYVGHNKGNYRLSATATNGRRYDWVAPLSGIPQGDYAPYVLLITPKKQQVITLGGEYQIDSHKLAGVEMAASNYVPNLFGNNNKQAHWGFAGKAYYKETRFFGKIDSLGRKKWQLESGLNYERIQDNFKAIAPFRNVEFERDWNFQKDTLHAFNIPDEQLLTVKSKLVHRNLGDIAYEFAHFDKGSIFKGNRNIAQLNFAHQTWKGRAVYNITNSTSLNYYSRFLRPYAFIEKELPKINNIIIGSAWESERNAVYQYGINELNPISTAYNKLGFYIKNAETKNVHYALKYDYRADETPDLKDFKPLGISHTVEGSVNISQWKGQQISLTAAYRNLQMDSAIGNNTIPTNNILARLQYNGRFLKGMIIPATLFEIGSGQQQKQEYVYIQVPTGQGIYMWVDYNNDGIQQENEFEIALYPDQKQFIRILSPTNDYVGVHYVIYNQTLMIRPESLWQGRKKNQMQQFVSKFNNQLSIQVNNRSLAQAGMVAYNPFANSIQEQNIINNSSLISNTLFFNQMSSVWGLHYNYLYRSGKSLLTYGLEGGVQERNIVEARWVFLKNFTATLNVQKGQKAHYSPLLNDKRTYEIQERAAQPGLTWIKAPVLRLQTKYKYEFKENSLIFGGEKAIVQTIDMGCRVAFKKSGNINIDAAFSNIRFNGQDNTSLSFVMLDALKDGKNWLWHLSWDRNIGKGIRISLDYAGRKPAGNAIIHTGTMSIHAML